jgi:hypothetical protein
MTTPREEGFRMPADWGAVSLAWDEGGWKR